MESWSRYPGIPVRNGRDSKKGLDPFVPHEVQADLQPSDQYLGAGGLKKKRAANFRGFAKFAQPSMKRGKRFWSLPNSRK